MLPVGIGKGIKERELEILAGDKGHYFHIGNFLELCSFLERLKDAACGTVLLLSCISSRNIHLLRNKLNTLNFLMGTNFFNTLNSNT